MDNSEHEKNCICAWCEVGRQNAEIRRDRDASARRSAAACSPSSDTPETDKLARAWLGDVMAPWNFCRKLERERDAALMVIEQIEERYIDGCDTYEDWKFMGNAARNFLYPENAKCPSTGATGNDNE